jgi:cell division septation protein DedD
MKSNPQHQIWITRSHLGAFGATAVGLAALAFFLGMEVGRNERGASSVAPRATLLPDAASDDALEALLREVEAAQKSATVATGDATSDGFSQALAEARTMPEPPPAPVDPAAPPGEQVAAVEPPPMAAPEVAAEPPPAASIPAPGEASMLGLGSSAVRPTGGWAVQIASYHTVEEADARVGELVTAGYKAYQVTAMVGGRTWYRVRVGGYGTKESANEARLALVEALGSPDLVVAAAP